MWTLTSPDGIQAERYIVEFECRVRNITFVEKYMSVSASGGTGRVATTVSCFGGLGQLYRVKVWAVSGPNISPTLVCTPDGQCSEEGEGVAGRKKVGETHACTDHNDIRTYVYVSDKCQHIRSHIRTVYLYILLVQYIHIYGRRCSMHYT